MVFEAQVADSEDIAGLREQVGMCFEELGDARLISVSVVKGSEPSKIGRGAYGNVMLSDVGVRELEEMFGKARAEALIANLSYKLHQKNYKFADHFALIVEWSKQQAVSDNNSVLRLNTADCNAPPNCYGRTGTEAGRAVSFDVDEFFEAAVKRTIKP
jgi:hypothetical protein